MAACLDYLGPVDRKTIARTERRRQALEALEFERARAAALQERLEAIVAELDGPALDATIFADLAPGEVEIVRAALQSDETEPAEALDGELADPREEQKAWLEEELVRLEEELASSDGRQQAFERYLDALG